MKLGISIPISATCYLPGWALGLSLVTHLVLIFGPALQRQSAASDLPPLAVSFRLPAMLAPEAVPVVAASAPAIARAVSAAQPAVAPVAPVRTSVLAVAAAGSTSVPAVQAAAPSDTSSESVLIQRAVEPAAAPAATDPEAMARYVRLLGDLLAQQQQYPRLAAARGWEGEVRLRLLVARKGTVITVHIVHSSGFDVLDQHAVQLVQNTLLPPPPNGTTNAASPDLTIDIPIRYTLKRS